MKETLYDVPAFIEVFVIRTRVGATLPRGDDSDPTRRDDPLSKRIRVVSFIAYHRRIRISLDQRRRLCYIIAGARRQQPPERDPVIAERQMKFRSETAPAPSESCLILSAFFFGAPAAHE